MVQLRSGATPHKADSESASTALDTETPARRGRGRPRKSLGSPGGYSSLDESLPIAQHKTPRVKRESGHTEDFETPSVVSDSGRRGKGRPRKSISGRADLDVASEPGTAVKRPRGRPSLASKLGGIDAMLMSPKPQKGIRSLSSLKFESEDEDSKPTRSLRSAGKAELTPDDLAMPPPSRPTRSSQRTPKTPKSPKAPITSIKRETPRSPKNKNDFPDMLTDLNDGEQPEEGTIVVTGSHAPPQARLEQVLPAVVVAFLAIFAALIYYEVLAVNFPMDLDKWGKPGGILKNTFSKGSATKDAAQPEP